MDSFGFLAEKCSFYAPGANREDKIIKAERGEGIGTICDTREKARRLEARPTAELCIDCKTLAELKEKQMTG